MNNSMGLSVSSKDVRDHWPRALMIRQDRFIVTPASRIMPSGWAVKPCTVFDIAQSQVW
jgi:hypothetical protein